MYFPTLDEAKRIAGEGSYRVIPVSMEIYSDIGTPIEVLRRLKKVSRYCYILESVEQTRKWGRYTFLGYEPRLQITCLNGRMTVNGGMRQTQETVNPGAYIREILKQYKSPRLQKLPPFTGGLVGYFSYDYIKYSEPSLKLNAADSEGFSDVDLMLFDKVIAFDNLRQKIILITNAQADDLETSYPRAMRELGEMAALIRSGEKADIDPLVRISDYRYLFSKEEYCEMVGRAKHYIREGDIFQVVLSNRIEADMEGSLFDLYRVLRTTNPSPYMFYFSGDMEIAGASPETLVKREDGKLYTYPLAGTRPRGATKEEDEALERELLSDEKECAEHNMLVDLGRNDIGRISQIGSVRVEQYMNIERYSHVMHIGSTVSGMEREDKDALDAVDAVLPAGTLSGAPKLRACEIINELEDNKRGIYGGAVGYLDFTGNMDTCIGIRLAFAKNKKIFIRSGAGIVADSVPENEYQECINKAKAVMQALEAAEGGIDHDIADR